jgi:membrane-associated protease RseP (regulator of RpoE activity)
LSPYTIETVPEVWVTAPKRRRWLHVLLFALTGVTTLAVGARLAHNFSRNLPAYDLDADLNPFTGVLGQPWILLDGAPFAVSLLAILLAHEMGHYLLCRRYGIAASYPYFLPAPTIIGTLGAFIRIKAPILSRRALFDIAIGGPLAGFALALPLLAVGVALSQVKPGLGQADTIHFGFPLLVKWMNAAVFPGVTPADVNLHPIARAAWVGLFATALNLLPAGQLDGGHLLYAWNRRWHAVVSRVVTLALGLPMLLLAFCWLLATRSPAFDALAARIGEHYWHGWFLWSAVLLVIGTRHPPLYDLTPIGPGRRALLALAVAMFALCFTPAPFRT